MVREDDHISLTAGEKEHKGEEASFIESSAVFFRGNGKFSICPRPSAALLSHLFHRFGIFKKGLSLFSHVRLVRICERDGLDITKPDALWVSVTVIALHRDPFLDIKERMAKGAGDDAGPASDAKLFVDRHPVIVFGLPVAGLCRTYLHAIGLFAVIASHGEIKSHILPLDHFDPGAAWIA
jgi:hypothetical protein